MNLEKSALRAKRPPRRPPRQRPCRRARRGDALRARSASRGSCGCWPSAEIGRYLAYKGSITVNGVSLTVKPCHRFGRGLRVQHQPDPAHDREHHARRVEGGRAGQPRGRPDRALWWRACWARPEPRSQKFAHPWSRPCRPRRKSDDCAAASDPKPHPGVALWRRDPGARASGKNAIWLVFPRTSCSNCPARSLPT